MYSVYTPILLSGDDPTETLDAGGFDTWVTNRIGFLTVKPLRPWPGGFDEPITDRIQYQELTGYPYYLPAGQFDLWLAARISRTVMTSTDVSTGGFNDPITDRIPYWELAGVLQAGAPPSSWPFWFVHYHLFDEPVFQFPPGSPAAPTGQPVMKRQQGIPTAAGYRDRPGKWN